MQFTLCCEARTGGLFDFGPLVEAPEPTTMALVGVGLLGLALRRVRD